MPVTIMVGDRDAKFRALGTRMTALLRDGEMVVVPGGHGLPLENPAAIAERLLLGSGDHWLQDDAALKCGRTSGATESA